MPRPVFSFSTLLLFLLILGIGMMGCQQANKGPADYSQDIVFTDVILIHHELQSIVDAGLTPYEAFKSGTANPAIFLGEEGNFGTLEVGAHADCIFLSNNPLVDVANLHENEGVMVRGRWLSKKFLQPSLQAIADKYLALN